MYAAHTHTRRLSSPHLPCLSFRQRHQFKKLTLMIMNVYCHDDDDWLWSVNVCWSDCHKIVISLRAERRRFLCLSTWPLFANTIISLQKYLLTLSCKSYWIFPSSHFQPTRHLPLGIATNWKLIIIIMIVDFHDDNGWLWSVNMCYVTK